MNRIFSFLVNRLQDVTKILLFIAAGIIITWFFPKSKQFKYEYNVGQLWEYADLYSETDYAIFKTDSELKTERKEAKEKLTPFYKKDQKVRNTVLRKVKGEIDQLMKTDTSAALKFGDRDEIIQKVEEVYSTGIIKLDAYHNDKGLDFKINILKENNNSVAYRVSEFYKLSDAFAEITSAGLPIKPRLLRWLQNILKPNILYDEITTQRQEEEALKKISKTSGRVQKGQKIISKGDIVDELKFKQIESLKRNKEGELGEYNNNLVYLGYLIITAIVLSLFWVYLRQFHNEVFINTRKLAFVLIIMVLILYITYATLSMGLPSIYLVPFCVVPIILQTYFGNRLAFYTTIIVLFLAAFITPYGKEFIFLHFVACLVSILANVNAHYWSKFFLATFYIFLAYVITFFGVSLFQEGNLGSINFSEFKWLALNVILTLLAYPLIPIFEKIFGFISDITLVELSDVNKPLLKKLQLEAPGTFQHSVQVANLAEAAANEIKVDPMLVKVAALYHDVGKINNPLFFIENQNTGFNPHENLSYDESAELIIKHVSDGIEIAKSYRLPDIIIDFIRTHHGNSVTQYFYRKYSEQHPDVEVDKDQFRYPGPLPYSKETAILMMADTVEAASKSLKNPSSDSIDSLIDALIKSKMEDDQFINSNITFKEINQIKRIFKKMLKSIYHVRIAYPEKPEKKEA